ncbi:hypothetical protein DY000_02020565 [Brassica cretica]|uniref:Uncharacterized protein n=1 Tax=Brassica cretica TaxID=69181 RepID=A0ABQ7ECY2_BRACR|nr:hypothetical protein DY000_02020565 [Brassica cretica]
MEGSPYRKFSISWKGARFQGPNSRFLLAGTWSVPLSGTRGSGSCLEAGGNDTGAPLRQDPVPSVLLAWVPLKPEFVLNPDERVPIGEDRGLLRLRFFLPSAPEMRTEAGLSPDSSSIESFTGRGSRYPPIGPPSVIGAEEVSFWRKKYELPDDVAIRVPDPENRVSDFGVDEVPVYEGYFPSGFRDQIPSLVAKISETLGISPGQLDPPAWRTLIALQNLGVLSGLGIGVAEVMCSYSVSPLSGTEWRYYHLRPRGKEPPVREILKKERKRLPDFEGNWTEKFAFMHLPVFSSIWRLEDFPRVDYSSGKDTIEQVLKLPLERRQIPFLLSKAALKRCSIRGEMSGSKGDEALAEYKKALEVMSARKAAPKRVAPTEDCKDWFLRVQLMSNSSFFCLSGNGETGVDFHFGGPLDRGGERKCGIFPFSSPAARNSYEDLEISGFLFPGSKKGKS